MKISYFIIFLFCTYFLNAQISVFSDFENGNVEFISSDSALNKLVIRPSLENEFNTTRCWFNFGITGFDTTRNLTIEYLYVAPVIAPEKPVFSYDQTKWQRLNATAGDGWSKKVVHKFTEDTVYFATGYPYPYSKVVNFVDSISSNPYVDTTTLVYSEAGLRVPMFVIQDTTKNPTNLVWITGRMHAFETTMNYVLEGIVNYLISDNKNAVKMRKNTIIYIVPMMDVDNVVLGASGRMQKPIDFNRDWSKNPHWNAVREVQKLITETSKKYNYRIFLDVHSTYPGTIRPRFGIFNEYKNDDNEYKKLQYFYELFKKNAGYELEEFQGDLQKNYSDAYSGGIIDSSIYVSDFSTTIECDWTTNHNGKPLTIGELRNVGKLLGETICDYLK